jgi:hypothetical protein
MKEVFTKSFWQGVKKTYYEALEGPPPEDGTSHAPAEGNLNPSSTSEAPPSPSPSSEAALTSSLSQPIPMKPDESD